MLLAYSTLRGYSRGLFGTLATFAAPVLAFMIAGDWSDPVRDRLAAAMPAPDFVLDMLAPALVFVAVVVVVRVAAALVARLFGLGMSVPSRVLAAGVGGALGAFVLGVLVVLIHAFAPAQEQPQPAPSEDPDALVTQPVSEFLSRLDHHLSESILGPPLAGLAEAVLSQALPEKPDAAPADRQSTVGEALGEFGEPARRALAGAAAKQTEHGEVAGAPEPTGGGEQ